MLRGAGRWSVGVALARHPHPRRCGGRGRLARRQPGLRRHLQRAVHHSAARARRLRAHALLQPRLRQQQRGHRQRAGRLQRAGLPAGQRQQPSVAGAHRPQRRQPACGQQRQPALQRLLLVRLHGTGAAARHAVHRRCQPGQSPTPQRHGVRRQPHRPLPAHRLHRSDVRLPGVSGRHRHAGSAVVGHAVPGRRREA